VVRGLNDVGRGAIEMILNSGGMYAVSDDDIELLRRSRRPAGGPVTWLALFAHPGQPDFHDQTFARLGDLVKQAIPQVTPRPIMSQGDLKNPTMFGSFISWQKAFNRPPPSRSRSTAIPSSARRSARSSTAASAATCGGRCACWRSASRSSPGNVGRTLEEIAASQGKRPVDAYFDLGIADDLNTRFQSSTFNFDPGGIERLITDDRCLIGLSDGGAHVDFICDVGYATALLDLWVRQRKVLSLEKAVHKLTQVPARVFGIPNRGVLAEGKVADLVLFDPDTVTAKTPKYAYDLPCNGRRLVSESEGIKATFVSGVQLYDAGRHTGAMPGRILRSYE
jgi:hypothetical protein